MRNQLELKKIGILVLIVLLIWTGTPTVGANGNEKSHVNEDGVDAGQDETSNKETKEDGSFDEQDDTSVKPGDETVDQSVGDKPEKKQEKVIQESDENAEKNLHLNMVNESDFEYVDNGDGTATITGFTGSGTEIEIPGKLSGLTVTRIGSNAFVNQNLTSIEIPDSVENIGLGAFNNNRIKNVYIPQNVEKIDSTFINNPLEQITVAEENQKYKDIDKKGLYTIDGKELIQGTISGEIATGTEQTGYGAFWGMELTEVHVPEGMKIIGKQSFQDNAILLLSLPNSLEEIKEFAFADNQLKKVIVPESVKEIQGGAFFGNDLTEAIIFGEPEFGFNVFFELSENPTQFVIKGYTRTSVKTYATENNYTFEPLNDSFAGGLGTEEYPYIVETADQLDAVREELDSHYKLGADIDLSDYSDGEGWEPIGMASEGGFKGSFDGNRKTISGLTIDRNDEYQGLFGVVSGANISNLFLEDVNVHGNNYTGSLVGDNSGKVIGIKVNGIVTGSDSVGGLVGSNAEGGITKSISYANVKGEETVGGLVGLAGGRITNSITYGDIEGKKRVGGLVGINMGEISASYATGIVTGMETIGGLVGSNETFMGGIVENSYWNKSPYEDEEIELLDNGVGDAKDGSELKRSDTFIDWDFTNIWNIYDGQKYPFLSWENPVDTMNVEISKDTLSIGEQAEINVTMTHADGETYEGKVNAVYTVDSDNVSVEKGTVVAKQAGEAIITVSLHGHSQTLPVTVIPKGSSGGGSYIPSSDTSLSKLEIYLAEKNILEFDPDQHEYVLETEEDVTEIFAEANHSRAKVFLNDEALDDKQEYPLKEGENVFKLVVTAENGDKETYTITINRLKEVPFTDIEGHWAENFIKKAYQNDWFKGYSDSTFVPNNRLSRMQTASLFVRILELDQSVPVSFTDAKGLEEETLEELGKAYAYGIIRGYENNTFKPYNDVSRAHIALMIARVYEQLTGSAYNPTGNIGFPDIAHYDEETQNAILLLKELGIAEGDDGEFKPDNTTTRAHAAKMLVNFKEVLDNL